MATYSSYVSQLLPEAARQRLQQWSTAQIRGATREAIVDALAKEFAYHPLDLTGEEFGEEITPLKPTDGVRVFLGFRTDVDAQHFLGLTPTARIGEPTLDVDQGYITFIVKDLTDVQNLIANVKKNIAQRNKDIAASAQQLRDHLGNVIDERIREVELAEAEAARQLKALAESGLEIRGLQPPPDDPATEPDDPVADFPPVPSVDSMDVPSGAASTSAERDGEIPAYVIRHPEERHAAVKLLDEIEQALHKALDTNEVLDEGAKLLDDVVFPHIDELRFLLQLEATSDAMRLSNVRLANRLMGGLSAAGGATRRLWAPAAAAVSGTGNVDDALENLRRLADLIP